ncbi:hypothetical protein [Nonomuraea sp. NPDC023979]|uniref:hypothetical protein n=1 Tax=Nonomuraea sp. NPDC023979 TaxID=3154796 RepID=UPI003408026E
MREELPRMIAFLFVSSAIGLLEIAMAKAFARAVREAREDFTVWRFRRKVRAHEAKSAADLDEQSRRGER